MKPVDGRIIFLHSNQRLLTYMLIVNTVVIKRVFPMLYAFCWCVCVGGGGGGGGGSGDYDNAIPISLTICRDDFGFIIVWLGRLCFVCF